MNILVVDDQSGILRSINKLLSRLGYNCYLFVNPEVALEAYAPEKFDVVVCDFMMPQIRGDAFLEKILAMDSAARVIVMSGYTLEANVRSMIDRGAYAFIEKPLDIEELLRLLRQVQREKNEEAV